MTKRQIIRIDEDKCNGCGLCLPNCPEGALQIIDGKVRLISDLFCDGLGACIGHCPQGAIAIEEREAERYDEAKVMENIIRQGPNVIKAHLKHLEDHGEKGYAEQAMDILKKKGIEVREEKKAGHDAACGCPGAQMKDFRQSVRPAAQDVPAEKRESQLRQWPVQIMLVPPHAPYFNGADLLIAADCVPFAYAEFHEDLLKGKTLLVGCPKLDDTAVYREKIGQILRDNDVRSVTYAHMEVPCCSGLIGIIEDALAESGKKIPFHDMTISIRGEKTVGR